MKYETVIFCLITSEDFQKNKSESGSGIVRLIGNRFLGSSAWFKTPTN